MGKSTKFCFKKNYLKDTNSTWAIAMLSAIHSPSVNSFFNVFLFFSCFLLYLWHYFSCNTEVNWQTGMEGWFGYWILVTIKFCELSFKFRQLLLFIWEATYIKHFTKREWTGAKLHPALVSGMVTGPVPVTNWSIFLPVTSNSPRSLCKN